MIDLSHLELVFKVRSGSQALDDDIGVFPAGILSQKLSGAVHLHIGQVPGNPSDQLHPFIQ